MKRRTLKKCMAFLTAAAIVAGSSGISGLGVTVSHAAEAKDSLIAEFTFDDATGSGDMTGGNAKATGTYTIVDSYAGGGKALHLNGSNQFLSLTKTDGSSLLTGLTELTISYEAKHERTATNWVAYAAPNTNAQTFNAEKYIGAFQNGGNLKVERYNNSGSRPLAAETAVSNDWTHVDLVYTTDAVIVYVNGEEKARQSSSYALTDILGSNSIFQVGKANWVNGEYCQASIDNFRVYSKALTAAEVVSEYQDYVINGDVEALTLPTEVNRSLTLPTTGSSGLTTITWQSGNPSVIANDGTVTRPAADTQVKLTATITGNGVSKTKEFTITVKKADVEADLAVYAQELTLNAGYVTEDLTLPDTIGDAAITWKSSDAKVIANDGKVTRADGSNKAVTLTATLSLSGKTTTKDFALTVIAAGEDIVSYISSSPATGQSGGMKVAVKGEDGYTALNGDQPILYSAQSARAFSTAKIFRKADGKSFGVVASDGGSNGNVVLYDSEDLITYSNERIVTLSGVGIIAKLDCVYDTAAAAYKLFIQDKNGRTYLVTSKDLKTFDAALDTSYTFAELQGVPSDASAYAGLGLSEEEYETLMSRFEHPYNTSVTVDKVEDIKVEKGGSFTLPDDITAQAKYSDGTTRTLGVTWSESDLAKVDTSRPGTYTVKGTVGGNSNRTDADSPLIPERADPFVTYNEDDGYYYFTSSYPMNGSGDADGYDRLILRRSKTISGLASAEEVTIWDESETDGYGRFIWAPELHKIGGSWYFVSTACLSETGNRFNIRPFMLKCNNDKDMMNPDSWGEPERVKPMAGDTTKCMNAMSLDMTYFEAGGNHYLVWADVTQGDSSLYIATIDPANPTQLTSKCSIITIPEYSWERVNNRVNEGATVIKNDGKVYLAFSASGTGMEYCIGVLCADESADLLDVNNWDKTSYPILTSTDFNNEVSGPGHNSFTVDEYGNPVIVYHARPTATHTTAGGVHKGDPLFDPCRHCYLKQVFFAKDGTPILNMTEDEFVAEEYRTVTVNVVVEGEAASTEPILEYNFDEEYKEGTAKDSAGKNDATLSKGATYVKDDNYGQVLYLDGGTDLGGSNSYLEFPQGFFDGKDSITISMDVNEVTRTGFYFTFAIGQNNQKYLFLKTDPTSMKLALTTNSFGSEKVASKSFVYPNNSRTWINVKMVITPTSIGLYQDGELIAENLSTGIKLSDLGTNLKAYLGKSFYSGDKYFRGYFDNVKVYDWAMTDAEIKTLTEKEEEEREAALHNVEYVSENFSIPNSDNIKGNITLPEEKDGVKISWKSSDEDVISTKTVKNEGYDDTPAGVVTRQAKDTKVTLTATFSKTGEESVTKTYHVTVKAKAAEVTDEDYVGYLFVHFTGTEENVTKEQTYFSISEDGLNWKDLNNNTAVLSSTFGESGLRDHYIARSPEGDKYYMIATDLSIATNGTSATWPEAGSNGSHSIVVWESDDLVNWSEPWLAEIAPENAGCTWAPEFIYDEATGEYVVYWSATSIELDDNENITQEYENHAVYYCKTRDFRTFTDAKVYHAGGTDANGKRIKVIDSTMIENDGTYYRYTKNESTGKIEIDKSDAVLGEFTAIDSKTLYTDLPNAQGAVEGPIIFKMNEKTAEGEDQWCLMVDRFARGQGYYPLITTDLESGEFRLLDSSEYSFPSKFRHGYVMPVTAKEYGALQRAWGDGSYVDTYPLKEKIAEASAIAADGYTDDSYKALQDAIAEAKAVLETAKSNTEVDAAVEKLQEAIDALKEVEKELPFVDVKKGDWFYDAVYYNYFAGIMTGLNETHFGPNESLARAQFAVILYRMNDTPDVDYKAIFPDVEDGIWYTDAILWASDTGVVTGYTDSGKFGPSDKINREQMAVMMYRYAKYKGYTSDEPADISGYKDADKVNTFAKEAMEWAVGNGIISGKDGGTVLDPQGNATRAECATIIMRFIEKFEK